MNRPEQHETDTQAKRLFEGTLTPSIVFRQQTQDDYGIDGELEFFEKGQTTGNIIKVQLKGSKSLVYVENGKEISFSLEMKNVQYWLEQVVIPVALVIVDVTQKKVFWAPTQGNKNLRQSYEIAGIKEQQTLTIRLNTNNVLPDTLPELVNEMEKGKMLLALRTSSKVGKDVYFDHLDTLDDKTFDSEIEQLKQKTEFTYVGKIDRFFTKGAYSEADKVIEDIFKSDSFSPYLKLHALIKKETVVFRPGVTTDRVSFYSWQASQMEALKDKLDRHRQILVEGFSISAEMSYLVFEDENLFFNWKIQNESFKRDKDSVDLFWLSMLPFERGKIAKRILECLEKFQKLLVEVLDKGFYDIAAVVAIRFFFHFLSFTRRLRNEELHEAANNYETWTGQVIAHTVFILERFKDKDTADDHMGRCALIYAMLALNDESKKEQWRKKADEVFTKIINPTVRNKWTKSAESLLAEIKIDFGAPEKPNWDIVKQVYVDQAKAIGIRFDLLGEPLLQNHPEKMDQDLARLIAVGIDDLDPTKILKNCSSLVFELSGVLGMPAMMLKLPTASRKYIGCVSHPEHGMVGGMSIVGCFSIFEKEHCSKCPDKTAHPSDWIYNEIWQNKQLDEWDKVRKYPRAEW